MTDIKWDCDSAVPEKKAFFLYKQLFDSLQEGYAVHEIICDEEKRPIDYRFLDVNPAFERLTGLLREQLVGHTVLEVLPATEEFWIQRYGDIALKGHPQRFEAFSGAIGRHYSIYAYCPQPGCFATLFLDITDRKLAEAALVAERNLFRTLIDAIPDRIFVKDRQSRFILNNIAHIKALGAYSQSEVLGKTRHDFRTSGFALPHIADRHLAHDQIVMENDKSLYIEEPTILPSGETGTLLIFKTPLHNSDGEVIGLIGFNRDISESRRVEESERRNSKIQNILREIAEATVLAVTLDELYAKVHQSVGRVLPAKNFYISLLDDTGDHLVVPYCVDETHTVPQRRPVGKGLTDYVMSQRKSVYVTPTELAQLRESGEVLVSTVNLQKWAGAPLIDSTGKAFGIVALFLVGEDDQPLLPEDLEVLSIIAAQVSLAIERKQMEQALRESEATYFALVQNSTAGIVLRNESGIITYANNSFALMMQAAEPSELLGRSYLECVHPEDRAGSLSRIEANILGATSPLREHRLVGLQGRTIIVESSGVPITKGGRPFVMGVFHDVTERKRLEELLKYQASTDGLTGIFNRRHFLERAEEELERIQRYGGICSLLMVDIDHFKLVNDNFGHAVGDAVLQRITALCKDAVRSTDLPGRVGGEEFAFLLLETGIAEAMQVAGRLCQSIQDTVFKTGEGIQIPLAVSVGVAEHQQGYESFSDLMIRSDKAMYRAKNEGRNKVAAAE